MNFARLTAVLWCWMTTSKQCILRTRYSSWHKIYFSCFILCILFSFLLFFFFFGGEVITMERSWNIRYISLRQICFMVISYVWICFGGLIFFQVVGGDCSQPIPATLFLCAALGLSPALSLCQSKPAPPPPPSWKWMTTSTSTFTARLACLSSSQSWNPAPLHLLPSWRLPLRRWNILLHPLPPTWPRGPHQTCTRSTSPDSSPTWEMSSTTAWGSCGPGTSCPPSAGAPLTPAMKNSRTRCWQTSETFVATRTDVLRSSYRTSASLFSDLGSVELHWVMHCDW